MCFLQPVDRLILTGILKQKTHRKHQPKKNNTFEVPRRLRSSLQKLFLKANHNMTFQEQLEVGVKVPFPRIM